MRVLGYKQACKVLVLPEDGAAIVAVLHLLPMLFMYGVVIKHVCLADFCRLFEFQDC